MIQSHDDFPEVVIARFNKIEDKKADVLKRMNEEFEGSPYHGLIKVVMCNTVLRNGGTEYEVTFICADRRKFIITKLHFLHIFHQQQKRKHRVNNLVKSYKASIAKLVKKYADEINEFCKYPLDM